MRWKLVTPHYLNVPGEVWEYIETDRKTGRPMRNKYTVPKLLHPDDPTAWTSQWGTRGNEEGEIIVCHEGKGEPTDQVFIGDPTPDMIPIDDEAKALSKTFEDRWKYKPETAHLTFSQSMIDKFQAEQAMLAVKSSSSDDITKLTNAIGELVKINQVALEKASDNTARRV